MRGFGYHLRLTPDEHAAAREALERAVSIAPTDADCIAMLSWVTSHEVAHGFNPRPASLDRALADFAASGEALLHSWFEPALVAELMVRLRKAGLGAKA